MKRPLSNKRPIGPFAQSSSRSRLALIYTTSNTSSFPTSRQLENLLDDRYSEMREGGMSDVVAAGVDVNLIGGPTSESRAYKIDTGVAIMSKRQLEAVMDVTNELLDEVGAEYSQVAVGVSDP